MVGDGFALRDVEAAPAFALFGLQALEEVEEGDWRGGLLGVGHMAGEVGEDGLDGPGRGLCG